LSTNDLPARFQPTRWSLVLRSRGEGREAERALADLCQAYWFPLYAWCRRKGLSPADAADSVQGFFVQVLEKQLFHRADEGKGKLRTFLLTALQRQVRDERIKQGAARRDAGRTVSFDAAEAESWYVERGGATIDDAQLFDRQWALAVLDQAVRRLEDAAQARGTLREFTALRPFLTREGTGEEYRLAAAPLGQTEGAFKVAVHRLRARFGEALRAEVAETQSDDLDVNEEIAYLRRALG